MEMGGGTTVKSQEVGEEAGIEVRGEEVAVVEGVCWNGRAWPELVAQ